jgi:hypothetical protein
MSKIEVNAIEPQCGTTLTLGASGDTVTLACGASQTGFGRTGTVDWQTGSIKTATFTAANGEGYFANTSGGAFTMNLPAGSAGAIVSVVDYTNTFQTNNLTISPNGSEKIGGIAAGFIASTEGQSLTFVYVDATEGWKNVQDSTSNATGNPFIVATGGTITTCGNCKIHTFTGPGTFTVSQVHPCAANNLVSHLVIAGGAGGGGAAAGGGGGAGGYREVKSPVTPYTASPLDGYPSAPNRVTVTATAYPITVGGGGAAKSSPSPNFTGNPGSNSVFSTVTSAGGGGGGMYGGGLAGVPAPAPLVTASTALNGGSGGGGGSLCSGSAPLNQLLSNKGTGNTPPVSPSQGNNGGNGKNAYYASSGGGGGASSGGADASGAGTTAPTSIGGAGGNGVATSITGSPVTRAGGGGGASYGTPGSGGPGGGGNGALSCSSCAATSGTANTGSGGGGGGPTGNVTGAGGSGIVIIRYKFQ